MAEKRMFSKHIVDSDAFLDMPTSAQALYFHIGMRADDDGFLNNPKKVMRMCGAAEDDLKLLLLKRFLLSFQSGVVVVKHWRMNNTIRKDRSTPTVYQDELKQLCVKENGAYTEASKMLCQPDDNHLSTTWQPNDNHLATQTRLDYSRLDKTRIVETRLEAENGSGSKRKRDIIPTFEDVVSYCKEQGLHIDPRRFWSYCEAKDWRLNGEPIRNWKALAESWEQNERNKPAECKQPNFDMSELQRAVDRI